MYVHRQGPICHVCVQTVDHPPTPTNQTKHAKHAKHTKHKKKVRVLHDVDCVQVNYPEDNSGQVELTFHETDDDEGTTAFTQRFDWVVGADGVKSAVRGACEARTGSKKVRAVKLPERNEFVYKTLPLDLRPRCVVALRCVVCFVVWGCWCCGFIRMVVVWLIHSLPSRNTK